MSQKPHSELGEQAIERIKFFVCVSCSRIGEIFQATTGVYCVCCSVVGKSISAYKCVIGTRS